MAVEKQLVTFEDFVQFALQPENAEREFELINGEIIEKMPGRTSNSELRDLITVPVHIFCRQHKIPCHTSGEAGAYRVGDHVVVPDFAFKRTPMSSDYPDSIAPEWAVEVISPTDKASDIHEKRQVYIQAGILLWELYPKSQSIDVYAPGKPMKSFGMDDMLDGGDVLPGFTLPVRDIFATLPAE
jgi:Uma2 family endonuclease